MDYEKKINWLIGYLEDKQIRILQQGETGLWTVYEIEVILNQLYQIKTEVMASGDIK